MSTPSEPKWDLFVSHASEDKISFVQPLVEALKKFGLRVWYDSNEVFVGGSLAEAIEAGLRQSMFGLIVLSPTYFKKEWTKKELKYYLSIEADGRGRILPIWHNIEIDDIRTLSPLLLDRYALSSALGIGEVARTLAVHLEQTRSASGQSIEALRPEAAARLLAGFKERSSSVVKSLSARPDPARVLIVDDNVEAAETLAVLLGMEFDVEAFTVITVEEALERLRERPVDLILLDIGLPGLDGYDGALAFHVEAPNTPIVHITGWGQPRDKEKAVHHAAYFVKPVDPDELTWLCADLLDPRGFYALCIRELGLGAANYRLLSETRRIAQEVLGQLSSDLALDSLINHKVQDFVRDYCRSQFCNDPRTSCATVLRERVVRLKKLITRRQRARDEPDGFLEAYLPDMQFEHPRLTLKAEFQPAAEALLDSSERGIFLRLCVMELVDNATESTEEPIAITISGRRRPTQGDYLIRVENSGPPIEKALASRLFVEGFSTRGAGRGMGLSLMASLAPRYNISLEAISLNPVCFGLRVRGV